MTRELQDDGFAIGRRRTVRLMRENGLRARQKRRFKPTTDSEHSWPIAPNIIAQDFTATAPNETWGVCCRRGGSHEHAVSLVPGR